MDRVSGSDKDTQLDLEGLPRHVLLTNTVPTYQMKVSDLVLSVVSETGEDGSGIVTLPSLAESVGRIYCVLGPTGSTDDDVRIYEKETGALHDKGKMNHDEDYTVFFSTGNAWLVLRTTVS